VRTRDWVTVDFYAVLGVAPTASAEEIGLAFRTLAKRLHPDRVGASAPESEQFKSVTAAYDVLGDERLRRNYDRVRIEAAPSKTAPVAGAPAATTVTATRSLTPEMARRRARQWTAAGAGILVIGIVVTTLVVRLQVDERAHRAGRVKTDAVLLVSPTRTDIRFTTSAGVTVQVPEPTRVNPGAERDGQRIGVLYRPDRPTDVILDESTAARDITLWIVALKLLVGGVVFLVVGIRRFRSLSRFRSVSPGARAAARGAPARAPGRA
jgi:hypothetical protein